VDLAGADSLQNAFATHMAQIADVDVANVRRITADPVVDPLAIQFLQECIGRAADPVRHYGHIASPHLGSGKADLKGRE
jgi:hypothetical protein